ncbi:MAG: hypothetical protein LC746_08630 [Acidobacteria bacterium]|nr:hypothetical protein [Acidobacteriota bacterium]
MLELRSSGQTFVRRVKVGATGLDAPTARARVTSAFAALDLAPSSLAPSAILCVKSLRDPRSLRLTLAHGAAPPRAWRESVADELERLARAAARPARGHVAASAESVVFADRAELLACLAADWCGHALAARWWWRSLFGETPDRRAVVAALAAAPEHLPGAFAHLARARRAEEFAAALAAAETRELLDRLALRFDLASLRPALDAAPGAEAHARESAHAPHDSARAAPPRPTAAGEPRAPWSSVAPEADAPRLPTAAKFLLGVALTLARAPALLRRTEFSRRAFEWARDDLSLADVRAASPRANEPRPLARARERSAEATTAQTDLSRRVRARAGDSEADGGRESGAREGWRGESVGRGGEGTSVRADARVSAAHDARARAAQAEGAQVSGARKGGGASPGVARIEEGESRESGEASARAESEEPRNVARGARVERPLDAQIETEFGGLFFLVNLALYLELYGDFTSPAAPRLPLDVWDFVALLGRELAGARVERDAVWSLLARLAGRAEDAEPGGDFAPADEWRVSAAWLEPFPRAGAWRWSAADGRLRVSHPAGFLVVDVPRRARDARRQLRRELRPYRDLFAPARLRRGETGTRAFSRQRHAAGRKRRVRASRSLWLERLADYARARLALALATRDAHALSGVLLERRARVFVTASHVDVMMSLAELPVAVRCAGLDRDPGWLPAAARHVAFRFE